jgi:hypothetical protein
MPCELAPKALLAPPAYGVQMGAQGPSSITTRRRSQCSSPPGEDSPPCLADEVTIELLDDSRTRMSGLAGVPGTARPCHHSLTDVSVLGGRANIDSTLELAMKTSNEIQSFHDDQLQPERSNSVASIVRFSSAEEGSVRGVGSQQLGRKRSISLTSIARSASGEEGSFSMAPSHRASNSSSRQPSRLWVEKGSFWTSLELTDQSTTLGNSSQHRIHQLKVRRLHRTCVRGARRSTPVHHAY